MRILVLNDGSAWSTVSGCRIFNVPDEWDADRIEEELDDYFNSPGTTYDGDLALVHELSQ